MSIIKTLPDNLISQIAAGEVIERPASVIKELIENSLDSGATNIDIQVREGGKTYIEITDNGKGINKNDLQLALTRHATSKISSAEDLWDIHTLGFRGEALASIASVSKLQLISQTANQPHAYQITNHGGKHLGIEPSSLNQGTKIIIQDLFFNTPARKKYLKTNQTENSKINQLLTEFALAHPEVQFTFQNNKKTTNYPKAENLHDRITQIFGRETAQSFLPLFFESSTVKISGYIGKPAISRSTSQHQYIFVNGRSIKHHLLAHRLKAAYSSMLMEHKKPVFIINIKINPDLIDVNVHPRKLEIRFQNDSEIIKHIYNSAKKALEKDIIIPKAFTESKRYMSDAFPKATSFVKEKKHTYTAFSSSSLPVTSPKTVQAAIQFTQEITSAPKLSQGEIINNKQAKIIAISNVQRRYIIAKKEDGILLIDQHAAHERVRFETLMDQFHNQQKNSQPLLIPQQIELSPSEKDIIQEHLHIFTELGFDLQHFGSNTFNLYAVPHCLSKENHTEIIKDVIDDIKNQNHPTTMQGKSEQILTYMACRSAVKFGDHLSLDEMQAIIDQLQKTKKPSTCPHGRPTMLDLSLTELEKMFGRRK